MSCTQVFNLLDKQSADSRISSYFYLVVNSATFRNWSRSGSVYSTSDKTAESIRDVEEATHWTINKIFVWWCFECEGPAKVISENSLMTTLVSITHSEIKGWNGGNYISDEWLLKYHTRCLCIWLEEWPTQMALQHKKSTAQEGPNVLQIFHPYHDTRWAK